MTYSYIMKKNYTKLGDKAADYYCYKSIIFFWLFTFGTIFAILFLFPSLDISFSKLFYNQVFYHRYHYLAIFSFRYTPLIINTAAIIYLCTLIYQYLLYKKINKILIYLIISLAIGPGLIVNTLFKNQFGRARPIEIKEFGGQKTFSRPFILSNQCNVNCSFTSGHAAAGYYATCAAFIVSRKRFAKFFHIGIVIGSLVGFARIVQGAHFLSDVIGSGFIVILINYFCWEVIFRSKFTVQTSPLI